jgi:hypothetical protein
MHALLTRTRDLVDSSLQPRAGAAAAGTTAVQPQQAVHLLWAMYRIAFTPPQDYIKLLLNEVQTCATS